MSHWSDKYIGKKYIINRYDCSTMVAEVLLKEFNKCITLPNDHGDTSFKQQRQILRFKDDLVERIPEGKKPIDGDGILLIGKGRENHIGIYYKENGVEWILHNAQGVGHVIRTRVRQLELYGYKIEGYYKWK